MRMPFGMLPPGINLADVQTSGVIGFLASRFRARPRAGTPGGSPNPRPVSKSCALHRAYGHGSLAQFDRLVAHIGRRKADRIWREAGPDAPFKVEELLGDYDALLAIREVA